MRKNIILNAPIQNKEFDPDARLGKVVPLFVADWLRVTKQDYSGQEGAIDLWNNVLASEQIGHSTESYAQLSRERLQRKYASRTLSLLRNSENIVALADTDKAFLAWAGEKVDTAIERGDVSIKKLGVFACGACDATLAVAEGTRPGACVGCRDESQIYKTTRPALVGTITHDVGKMVDVATGVRGNENTVLGDFIVNKKRLGGVPLERYGFKNDVLDPRIGLGLLATYAAHTAGADGVDIIASKATIRQNLPQFFAATASQQEELPRMCSVGIAKAPVNYLMYLRDEGILNDERLVFALRDKLSPSLLTMRQNDMSPQRAEQLILSRKTLLK